MEIQSLKAQNLSGSNVYKFEWTLNTNGSRNKPMNYNLKVFQFKT